jgi:amidophosphoribosyltransferase
MMRWYAVREIYAPFTVKQISDKIAEMLRAPGTVAEVEVVYQSIEGLHEACPDHTGDWYFTGNYPTPGGNRVVNRAYMNFIDGINARAY